jgi:hypothetical protein
MLFEELHRMMAPGEVSVVVVVVVVDLVHLQIGGGISCSR